MAVIVALVVAVIPGAPAAAEGTQWYRTYQTEAETMQSSGPVVALDTGLSMGPGSKAWRRSETTRGSMLVAHVRATTCSPAPTFRMLVDGKVVFEGPVSGKVTVPAWTTIGVGTHTLAVAVVADGKSTSTCARRVFVDRLEIYGTEAINTGTPASTCIPYDGGLGWTPPGPDINTTWLGPAAPAYYELAAPLDGSTSTTARGTAILVHGGGWSVRGNGAVAAMRDEADEWRHRGWSTVSVSYRGCGDSLPDVLWFYDAVRKVTPTRPVCVVGASAGAQLALMTAALRPDVDCVVSYGGPTDLTTIGTEEAYDPATGGMQTAGPQWVSNVAEAAFRADALTAMSPVAHARALASTRVVLATAEKDPFVPVGQARALADAILAHDPAADVQVVELTDGDVPFVHADVSEDSSLDLDLTLTATLSLL